MLPVEQASLGATNLLGVCAAASSSARVLLSGLTLRAAGIPTVGRPSLSLWE